MEEKKQPTETVTTIAEIKPVDGPVRPVRQVVLDSNDPGYVNRLLIGTPSTGQIRMEWAAARYGQIIPTNWSMVQMVQWMNGYIPIHYSVADAQNLIIKEAIEKDFEWLLLVEQDNVLPPDAFIRFNEYMRDGLAPVVSGVYFTKSTPSEPLVYRGRGNSCYKDWKFGDKVECDGVPTGCLLIHMSILREMWKDSSEYLVNGIKTRRIFETPRRLWMNPADGQVNAITGTSDLDWCTRVMEGKYFEKAGWPQFQAKKYPFIVDTNIFCRHIDENGIQYPQV